jgi:hypothetical protein
VTGSKPDEPGTKSPLEPRIRVNTRLAAGYFFLVVVFLVVFLDAVFLAFLAAAMVMSPPFLSDTVRSKKFSVNEFFHDMLNFLAPHP